MDKRVNHWQTRSRRRAASVSGPRKGFSPFYRSGFRQRKPP